MQLLSSQEINQVSGAFSATKVLDSASNGLVFAAVVGFYLGTGTFPAWPVLLQGAAIFGGVNLAYQAAESFDAYIGTKPMVCPQYA